MSFPFCAPVLGVSRCPDSGTLIRMSAAASPFPLAPGGPRKVRLRLWGRQVLCSCPRRLLWCHLPLVVPPSISPPKFLLSWGIINDFHRGRRRPRIRADFVGRLNRSYRIGAALVYSGLCHVNARSSSALRMAASFMDLLIALTSIDTVLCIHSSRQSGNENNSLTFVWIGRCLQYFFFSG